MRNPSHKASETARSVIDAQPIALGLLSFISSNTLAEPIKGKGPISMPQTMAGPADFEIDTIRGIIAEYVGVNVKRVIDDAHFCDDLGLDWLERLELVLRVEDETGIEISESDATRIENVGNLLRHIEFAINKSEEDAPWSRMRG